MDHTHFDIIRFEIEAIVLFGNEAVVDIVPYEIGVVVGIVLFGIESVVLHVIGLVSVCFDVSAVDVFGI